MNWLEQNKIPLGQWMEFFVDWLVDVAAGFFDFISETLESLIVGFVDIVDWFPPLVVIATIVIGAWLLHRSIGLVLFIAAALLLIINMGYWLETIQTLMLVISATTISVIIGVPIGIAAAHRPWLYTLLRPILDLMQTIPTFVYLIQR
jgi:glycine betaine/proline transport system permease protein